MSRKDIASKMAKMVREYSASGQSRKMFSASRGVSEGKLHYWVKKLSAGKAVALADRSAFVPIDIPPPPSGKADQVISIHLPNGVEIKIPV